MSTFRGPLLPANRRAPRLPQSLDGWTGFAMIAAAHEIELAYARVTREIGISLRDFVVLAEVARRPGMSQATLAHHVGLTRSRVSEQLGVLDTAGYVEREMNPLDLRRRRVWLTEPGQHVFEEASERINDIDRGWLHALKPGSRSRFSSVLKRLPPAT